MDLLDTIHPSPLGISVGICRITALSGPLCCPRPSRVGGPHVREPNPPWDGLGRPGMAFVRCGTTPGDPSHHSKSIRHHLTTPNASLYSSSLKKVALAFDCASGEGLLSLLPGVEAPAAFVFRQHSARILDVRPSSSCCRLEISRYSPFANLCQNTSHDLPFAWQ